MKTLTRFIGTWLVLAMAGCGGGGSGDSPAPNPPAPPPPPPPTDALPGGHWFGTVTNDLHAVTEEYVALVDENGRFRFVSVDSTVQMSGNFAIVGDALTGDGTAFADAGVVWLDSKSATPVTIEGTISSRSGMSGTWTTTAGELGTFEFFYDPTFYERASPLDLLAGSWIAYDELMNPEATFTIVADGSFTGQNVLGCNTTGQFAIVDADFNLYEVQSTIADCALAGDYIGLAFLADLLVPNDALILANDNGSRAFLTGFQK